MAATTDPVPVARCCLRDAMSPAGSPALTFCDMNGHSACGGHRLFCPPSGRRFTPCIAHFMALCVLFVAFGSEIGRSQELDFEKARYALAVEYCRGNVERLLSLSADHQTLCFDGPVERDLDLSQVRDLKEHGLFVVRSPGGFADPAIEISNLLDAKRATVVAYDYCLSACASFFFIASGRTYVFEKALVAFHYPIRGASDCAYIGSTSDNEDKRLIVEPCPTQERIIGPSKRFEGWQDVNEFCDKRTIDRQYGMPPQSSYMRKYLKALFEQTGEVPGVLWMWNPRFYRSAVKTEISYEDYPDSQSEVDELAARFHLGPIIFDP
jgi:hypothetical protein